MSKARWSARTVSRVLYPPNADAKCMADRCRADVLVTRSIERMAVAVVVVTRGKGLRSISRGPYRPAG
jgi:hypothetical protein